MSQPPHQPSFEGADLQLYPDLSDLDHMFLSDDMGLWPGYDGFSAQLANPNLINPEATWPVTQTQQECSAAGPNTFNLDAHLEPSYHKYSFADEANTSGTLQTYAYGNTGLSVPGKHRSSPGNSLWTSDILPLTQWSSDAFAVTHSVDSSLLPLTDTTKSLISVPLDRVNYSQYGSNHRSSCWPPVTLPDAAILTAAFSGTTFPTSPIAMHYNIFERPSEGPNTSVRQDVSTPNVTAAKHKHLERGTRSAAVSEQRDLSTEAEAVDHGPTESTSGSVCHECGDTLRNQSKLELHAAMTGHAARRCKCGKGFTRMGDLTRHLKNFKPGSAEYPCTLCRLHRGDKAFKRKDHLTQHIRSYHHIDDGTRATVYSYKNCSHLNCPQHLKDFPYHIAPDWKERIKDLSKWNGQLPFQTQAAQTKHRREVHDESPFPCDVAHCPKNGGKGYVRKRDMLTHRKRDHPDAPEYIDREE